MFVIFFIVIIKVFYTVEKKGRRMPMQTLFLISENARNEKQGRMTIRREQQKQLDNERCTRRNLNASAY